MIKAVKLNAEEQLAATQKKYMKVRKENETRAGKETERISNLKALRLAKEAADKKAAKMAAAEKLAAKAIRRRA